MAFFPALVRKDTGGTYHEDQTPGRPHQKGRNTRTPHATYLEALCKAIGAEVKADEVGKAGTRRLMCHPKRISHKERRTR
jgi:hypothetical protein